LAPSDFTLYARSSEFVPYWVAQVWPWSQHHNEIYLLPLAAGLLWLFLRCYWMTEFFENYLGLLHDGRLDAANGYKTGPLDAFSAGLDMACLAASTRD
jgi:hypothetical protein